MDDALQRQLAALSPEQRELFLRLSRKVVAPAVPAAATELATGPTAHPEPRQYAPGAAQERFWLLERLHPGEPAHHVAGALTIEGHLDVAALQRALDELVVRHDALRTVFGEGVAGPQAIVLPAASVRMAVADLTGLAATERVRRGEELRRTNTLTPFDLAAGPLLRCVLVRLGAASWQLLFCVHHIAADGLSMVVLARDLATLLGAREVDAATVGAAATSAAPQLRYHDWVRWQGECEQAGAFRAGLEWQARNLLEAPTTALPIDHERTTPRPLGARVRRALPREVELAMRELGQRHGCTPFQTLLGAFAVALARWLDTDDVVFGIPVANRTHGSLHDTVGLFVNSVVLRLRPAPMSPFPPFLQQVRTAVQAALVHAAVPFERLVRQLRPERHLDRNPLFQVMFNYVDFATLPAAPPGQTWHYDETPAGTLFDFTLYVRSRPEGMVIEAEYDTSLYTAASIERRLTELLVLWHGIVSGPETPLAVLPLLATPGRSELRALELGPPLPAGPEHVLDLVRAAAARHADALAVSDENGADTYRELLQRAHSIAAVLRTAGVGAADRVAFLLERTRALPAVLLGIWLAGAVAVPLDAAQPSARRDEWLAAAGPRALLVDAVGPHAAQRVPQLVVPLPRAAAAATPDATPDAAPVVPGTAAASMALAAPDVPAYVLFTSGSTGKPKGVVVPHRALAAFLRAAQTTFGIGTSDEWLAITSPTFDIALLELLLPLCVGARVQIAAAGSARDGEALARALVGHRPTFLQATPSTFRLLLASGWRGQHDLRLLCGGEVLDRELAAALRARCGRLWNVYGPTETTIWSTASPCLGAGGGAGEGDGEVRIGRPLPGTECLVLSATGERMPIGCRGELWLGGAGVAAGYLDDEAATARAFVTRADGSSPGRYYRTGDMVRWMYDGELAFVGRRDHQVKVRGHRLELAEVELLARACPDLADAVAVPRTGDDGTEIVLHVVPRASGGEATVPGWRDVWQDIYGGPPEDPDFDCRGWLDSRTGRAIPIATMRNFVAATVARLRDLAPAAVLEVGCGTGLIAGAFAGECARWLALDPAPAAVAAVAALARWRGWRHLETRQLAADALDELPAAAFDCVLLNSVVQYFPSLDYLLGVLAACRRRLRANGVIVLGDVRLLPLQEACAAWIERARAGPGTTETELAARIATRVRHEPELLLAPGLFDDLVARGCFADRWLALRAGGADTEMDRFRADVVLTVDSTFAAAQPVPAGIGNARVSPAPGACEPDTLGPAIVPTSDGLGLAALAPPLASRTRGATAVAALPTAGALRRHANVPHGPRDDDRLRRAVRAHLAARLPAAVLPTHIVVHEQLPTLPSGKVDRRALPHPGVGTPRRAIMPAAGATTTEHAVAGMFAELLGGVAVAPDDDFFALGGHSLAAARLLARIRATFAADLPLRTVFAMPTVRALAAAIDRAAADSPPVGLPAPARPAVLRPGSTMVRLWFLQRLVPRSRAYSMFGVLEASGPLDLEVLRRALADVVARHEILRLRLVEHEGEATLVPNSEPVPLDVVADADAFAATLRDLHGDEMAPLRVLCCQTGAQRHRVAFVLHHAFADGWSLTVLEHDLARAYASRARGEVLDWAPLPLQFVDYTAAANARLQATERQRLASFWRAALQGAPAALTLPTRSGRPALASERGAAIDVTLPAEVVAAARHFARQQGATLFQVVLAAFQVWLARLAGQDDVVVGTTIANRDDPRLEGAIGCFVQSLPLRANLVHDPSFAAHVAACRDGLLAAMEHRQLPFQDLVAAIDPERSLARTPLFQATLDWLNVPAAPAVAGPVAWTRVAHDPGTAKFDLALVVLAAEPFTANLEFRTDLFARATVAAWWRAFTCLLAHAIAAPATPVSRLPLLEPADRAAVFAAGCGPARQWPAGDVLTAIAATAAARAGAVALTTATTRCTYGELLGRVAELARTLQAAGVRAGDRVAVHLPRDSDLVVAVLAVLAAGAAYVPLDVDLPTARKRTMLAVVAAQYGVTDDAAALGRELPGVTWCLPGAATASATLPERAVDLGALAYVLFTSGSTGTPKAVAIPHRALRNYVAWAAATYAAAGGAVLHTPLGFDLSITSLFPVLAEGGTVHLPAPGAGIAALLAALPHGPFGLIKLTPSHLRALLAVVPPAVVANVARGLVLGGEALDHELLAPLRQANPRQRHWNEYGPTEATVGCAIHEVVGDAPATGAVPIGGAIANTRLYVLDRHRQPVPHGVIGELWIAGDGLAVGYFARQDLTDAAFAPDPFVADSCGPDPSGQGARMYRSGDLASYHGEQGLWYHGRLDRQVKLRGHRLELDEVRVLLCAQPGVRDAFVAVRTAPGGGEHVIAWFVGDADEVVLRVALAAQLASAAVPTRCLAVPALPFDRHGKLDAAALPEPWAPTAVPAPAAHGDDEPGLRRLVLLARELLRVPELTADDDFFRAGGDSILALQLVARASGLGVPIALADVFRHPRLRELYVASATASATSSAPAPGPLPTRGPLLPMQQWFFAQNLAAPDHYDQALWLTLRPGTAAPAVAAALHTLGARHPALRTAYRRTASGLQQCVLDQFTGRCDVLDVRGRDERDVAAAIGEVANAPGDFALDAGRVVAATFVSTDQGPRLHLRGHHLAVDAVSWRVLADDLDALLAGREPAPPTTSPLAFANWLHGATAQAPWIAAAARFQALPRPPFPDWAAGDEGNAERATATLDADSTRALLAARDSRHRVRADELFVAGIGSALARLLGVASLRLDLEGHGRAHPGAPPLHHSVGWFTTVHPLVLEELAAPLPERLARTKEQMRGAAAGAGAALPLGLAASPVSGNYLGIFDAHRGTCVLGADVDAGPVRDARNRRSHAIEVTAGVRGGELRLDVAVPGAAPPEFAAALATTLRDELVRSTRALATEAPVPCLVDWPLADLDRAALSELLAGADEAVELYPLTPTQQGMFFHAEKDPASLAYREQLAAILAGELQPQALLAAFADLAARHELLRGQVHWRGLRVPHWRIGQRGNVDLHTADLSAASDEGRALRELARAELRRPFAFGAEPLLRVCVVALARARHALVVTWHHVVLDGWSMPLLLGELGHLYRLRRGEELPALPAAMAYRDHIALLKDQDAAAQRAFWRRQLAGFTTPTAVPGDRTPSAATASGPWDECELRLDEDVTSRLHAFGRRHGITASTLVAAAWALALWRCTGSRDVLFGVTVSGRDQGLPGVERRIGLFINTLPLRVDVGPQAEVVAWLRSIQDTMARSLVHQHTPLPISQALSDVPRGQEPLQSLLVFENYPLDAALRELPAGLSLEATFAFERTSYPLTIVALPDVRFCLRLLHDTQRYSDTLAKSLLRGVAMGLAGMLAAPPSLAMVPWLSPMPLRGPGTDVGPPSCLLQRVQTLAAIVPDRIAVADDSGSCSYGELLARAGTVAVKLAPHVRGTDPLVVLCAEPGAAAIAAMLGIWWSGAGFVVLDPSWPATRLAECVRATAPVVIVTDRRHRERLPASAVTLALDEVTDSRLAPAARALPSAPVAAVVPTSLAYAVCTSGSTGRPKVVLIEHRSLAAYAEAAREHFALTPADRVLQFASLAFDTAQEEIWPALLAGATLVCCPARARASSAEFLAYSRRQQITVWDLPTAFFHVLAQALPHAGEVPPQLRLCILGGQACRAAAARSFLDGARGRARLVNTYGPSETTIVATWCELTANELATDVVPIGRPVPGATVFVLGDELQALPAGMPGELCVAGRLLARGYLGDEALTARQFVLDPSTGERLYRTGDRARIRGDGQLEFLGRVDRQAKVSGVRVELDEISHVLMQLAEVTDAMVVAAQPEAAEEPVLVAHFESAATVPEAVLRSHVARSLPAACVPRHFVWHAHLPRTNTGKVDLRALSELVGSSPAPRGGPASDREASVLTIFHELFPGREVAVDDDFFALGGDSLLAVRLLDLLQRRAGIELPLRDVFAAPTPGAIARATAGVGGGASPDLLADAQLPLDFPAPRTAVFRPPTDVLLTGATGFFGSHLLAAWLSHPDTRSVSCLVRANDEVAARERLRAQLAKTRAGAAAADDPRVRLVLGDVALPDLGLDAARAARLGGAVSAVVHAAAVVDFLRPYAQLRAGNVVGALQVLRFAAAFGLTLHHVSSVGIFTDARVQPGLAIGEDDDASAFDRPVGGYAQSKWVAEQLVRAGMARGVAGVVHRPGRLVGDLAAGAGNERDFASAIWRLCSELELAPWLSGTVDLTPVEEAAARLVAIAQADHRGRTFHLVNPEPPTGDRLVAMARAAGWSGRVVSWEEFRSAALAHLERQPEHPLRQFSAFLLDATAPQLREPRFLTTDARG